MHATPINWTPAVGWRLPVATPHDPDLILYFGRREALVNGCAFDQLRAGFPATHILCCSTGGQIQGDEIVDDPIDGIALTFEKTQIKVTSQRVTCKDESRQCGAAIGLALASDDLTAVFVLSDGLHVNGSELVAGIVSAVGSVPVSGGLAGDGSRFAETVVGLDGPPQSRLVAAVGFYGSAITIGHGSAGGWDVFGPKRRITCSEGNLLLALDGRPALELYERYLGEEELEGLPASALLFPLQIHDPAHPEHSVVRTVLAVDRDQKSLTFAGDMPQGWVAQLMRGTFVRLAAGAADAASQARKGLKSCRDNEGVAILVSCIGRRLLMGQRTQEEVEAAATELGPHLHRLGFYSYGEIAPHGSSGVCELHNQTMTVTTIVESTG